MMKNKNTIKTIFVASVILLTFFSFFHSANAADYTNQEKIPGAEVTSDFITYLKSIITFGFAIVGILALFMLIIGAYQYLMAVGSGKADAAKETIASALLGLVLGLCAWVILNKINPDLVNMRAITTITGTSTSGTTASKTTDATKTSDATKSTSSDISKVKCDAVRNYNGFMNKNSSDLSNENINSAQDVQNALTSFRKNNNGLTQYSDTIYQASKDNNVPLWYVIGTFAKESSMFSEGTKGCSGYNNPGCMMSGGKYISYSTPEEGIKENIKNMGRLLKNNDTPLEAWNKWYWPDRPDNNNENCSGAQEYLDFFSIAASKTGLST